MAVNNYYIYKLVKFITLRLPKKVMYCIAEFLAHMHYLTSKNDREAVVNNLKVIMVKSNEEIRESSLEVFKNFGRYLVDFFRSEEITEDYIKKHIKVEGLHHIDAALKKGKGLIVTSAHISNWELSAIVTAMLGYPLSIVAMVHKDKRVNDLFNAERIRAGVKIIPLGKAVRECIRDFSKNRMVALVGDRELGQGGIVVDFFGRKAIMPRGPAFLSLQTGAPIIPGFIVREGKDNFRFTYESFIEPVDTGNRTADIFSLTSKYIAVIERYVRKYPEQWLVFRKFWM